MERGKMTAYTKREWYRSMRKKKIITKNKKIGKNDHLGKKMGFIFFLTLQYRFLRCTLKKKILSKN